MKSIKGYYEFINEKLNILTGPSDEETDYELEKLLPNDALNRSIEIDYIRGVKKAIDRGADVKTLNKYGYTYLMESKSPEVSQILINNGVDVNYQDRYFNTALSLAVGKNNMSLIKCLVDNGANINVKDKNGCPLLIDTIYQQKLEIVRYLIESGADVNLTSENDSPLSAIINCGITDMEYKLNVVKCLVEHGANVNFVDKYGNSVLMNAAEYNYFYITKYLVEHGADVNFKKDGFYILDYSNISKKIVSYLLKNGAKSKYNY